MNAVAAASLLQGHALGENQPEDFVRCAHDNLVRWVREHLICDIARHVDATVHKLQEWGCGSS